MSKRNKNKTLAAWLAFVGGPAGFHRFYLHGFGDIWGWLHPIPTALGLWGIDRVMQLGQDDKLSWLLLPLLGLIIAVSCLSAILYALMDATKWNARHNPDLPLDATPGQTGWMTIFAIILSLLLGTTALMSGVAFSFQRFFEYQIEEGLKLSQ